MHNDIEQVISDNLCIKKAYHISKSQTQKLQDQLNLLKQDYERMMQKNEQLVQMNVNLNKKNKQLQLDLCNDSASFVSQIDELKYLIQQKQEQLNHIQIRMIPNLDQDMLRVKLIAEMQGPYQETVDKKDREITRLKDHLHQLKRDKEILEFSIKNKQRQAKRDAEEQKTYFQIQQEALVKQLEHAVSKQKRGQFEKDVFIAYRRQIDQLRATLECQKTFEEDLRAQVSRLKNQKNKLINDLITVNSKKQLQQYQTSNQGQIRQLKNQRNKYQLQAQRLTDTNQRLDKKLKNIEYQKNKIISNLQNQIKQLKSQWDSEKQRLKNQNLDHKQQIRRLKDIKNRQEEDYISICQKYKKIQTSYEILREENRKLVVRIQVNENSSLSNRQIKQSSEENQRKLRERIQRQMRIKIQKKEYSEKRQENVSPNRDDEDFKRTSKSNEQIAKLLEKNKRLTEKLQFANHKILELLQQKIKNNYQQNQVKEDHLPQRDISPEHYYNRILLEHRDSSFVPMVPPTLYEGLSFSPYL